MLHRAFFDQTDPLLADTHYLADLPQLKMLEIIQRNDGALLLLQTIDRVGQRLAQLRIVEKRDGVVLVGDVAILYLLLGERVGIGRRRVIARELRHLLEQFLKRDA